jgi:hypothetical protein
MFLQQIRGIADVGGLPANPQGKTRRNSQFIRMMYFEGT